MLRDDYLFIKDKFKKLFNENEVQECQKDKGEIETKFNNLFSGIVTEPLPVSQDIQRYVFDISKANEKAYFYYASSILKKDFDSYVISKNLQSLPPTVQVDDMDKTLQEFLQYAESIMSRFKNGYYIGLEYSDSISKEKAQIYYSHIHYMLTKSASNSTALNNYTTFTLYMFFAFNLCKFSGYPLESFFSLAAIFIQYLIQNDKHQMARDSAEQLFNVAKANNMGFYGAFIKMICFIRQRNFVDGFLFTIVCLQNLKNNQYIEFQNVVLTYTQTLFRETGNKKYEDLVFRVLKSNIEVFDYRNMLQIHLSHFAMHFELYNELYQFVKEQLPDMITSGVDVLATWYSFVLQIYNLTLDQNLKNLLDDIKKNLSTDLLLQMNAKLGLEIDFKQQYNKIIKTIKETRYEEDCASQIRLYKKVINKMIDTSIKQSDTELFINSFRLYSSVNDIVEKKEDTPFIIYDFNPDIIDNYYDKFLDEIRTSKLLNNFSLILCMHMNNDIYLLNITENRIIKTSFCIKDYEKLTSEISKIYFMQKVDDDNKTIITNKYSLFTLPYSLHKPFIFIFDNQLSAFPVQLFEINNSFICNTLPVVTMPSLDFYIKSKELRIKDDSFFWTPKETNNMTLITAIEQLSPIFKDLNINYETTYYPSKKINSDISIIMAHGADNIEESKIFGAEGAFGGQDKFYKLDEIFETSKLVILCICHSGRKDEDFLYETTQSLQDELFKKGVEAIIAPKWSLDINILPVWIKAFFSNFRKGMSSLDAFFMAQYELRKSFKNINACHCLHYFGNPQLKIDMS